MHLLPSLLGFTLAWAFTQDRDAIPKGALELNDRIEFASGFELAHTARAAEKAGYQDPLPNPAELDIDPYFIDTSTNSSDTGSPSHHAQRSSGSSGWLLARDLERSHALR